jgi:hypothetical protein
MDFGKALEGLRLGVRMSRAGWNGKGMFVALRSGYPEGVRVDSGTAQALGVPEGETVRFREYLTMWTANAEVVPWVASQTDVLASDWEVAGVASQSI